MLTHSRTWRTDPKLPPDLSDRMEGLWLQWQEKLCRLSTRSSHKVASKAGHYIQPEEPQLVIDAIEEVSRESQSRSASSLSRLSISEVITRIMTLMDCSLANAVHSSSIGLPNLSLNSGGNSGNPIILP